MSDYPMHKSPRCGAYARTTGQLCKSPAIKGKARCRMHGGKSPGRPKNHGRYAQAFTAEKRKWRQMILELNALIKKLGGERI